MKTTIDIPEDTLAQTMRHTGAKTKRDAVVRALEDYNRQQSLKTLVSSFGPWDIATNDELEAADIAEVSTRKRAKK